MRKPYIYIIGVTMALCSAPSQAQTALSPRTAIALADLHRGRIYPQMRQQAADQNVAEQKVSAYITINPAKTTWHTLGITPLAQFGNTATVRLSLAELQTLSAKEGVEYIQLTSGATQMLDLARAEAGTDAIHKGTALPQAYTGEGVVVGIVDAGFDYLHSAFRNPEDGALRIKRVWEQKSGTLAGANAPEKYGYGLELNTPELITAAQGDSDANSHGTHVAGIAAGGDAYKDGTYVGNAPDADIVLVALDLTNNSSADISNAVQYIFDYADEVNKPCVVNLSLGNHAGPHDGTSTFDVLADKMQRPGRLIVGAAGNHRTDKFHIDRTFASADDAPLRTFVKYKSGPSKTNMGGTIEIWGEKGTEFSVDIAAYSTFNKKDAVSTTVYPVEGVTEVEFGKYATGTWSVASEVSPLNGKPHVVLTSALSGIRANHAIALTITPKGAGRVNVWADNAYLGLESRDMEGFSAPDASSSTLCEIGGTSNSILTVGAYTTRNEYTTNSGSSATLEETVGALSSFSSYGPTTDGRMKPEITAPGCFIISAVSNHDASGTLMYADYNEYFDRNNLYGYMQGTSMASPFVAGIVATWLQAYPELSPEQLHEIAKTTARKDDFTATSPDSNWGYGKINALEGLQKCVEYREAGCESISAPFDGTISIAGDNLVLGFARNTNDAAVSVASIAGHTLLTKQLGSRNAGEAVSVALPGLAKGVYVVTVKTAKERKTYKFVRK